MMRIIAVRRAALALLIVVCSGTPTGAVDAADAPISVSEFFSADAMSQPVLSPSGKYLAVRLTGANGRRQLGVINLDPPRQGKSIVSFTDADIANVAWVNEDRLVFNVNDSQSAAVDSFAPGLYAIDRTGEGLRSLVKRQRQFVLNATAFASHELPPNHRLLTVVRDGSADVVIERFNFDKSRDLLDTTPLRLDTVTGR